MPVSPALYSLVRCCSRSWRMRGRQLRRRNSPAPLQNEQQEQMSEHCEGQRIKEPAFTQNISRPNHEAHSTKAHVCKCGASAKQIEYTTMRQHCSTMHCRKNDEQTREVSQKDERAILRPSQREQELKRNVKDINMITQRSMHAN